MALSIQSVEVLKKYIERVMERAEHHALDVNEIVFTLAGALVWKASDIKVRTHNDDTGNQLWFQVRDNSYCITYNHENGQIDLKKDNNNGAVIESFDNSSTALEVKETFESL